MALPKVETTETHLVETKGHRKAAQMAVSMVELKVGMLDGTVDSKAVKTVDPMAE